MQFDALPPIDLVLVSHDHYDHMDLPTLRRLAERDSPEILTGAGSEQRLSCAGISGAHDLDWWECREVGTLRVCATPARHNSGRSLHDHDRTLWLGFYISGNGASVYFAGDTAWGDHFAKKFARDSGRRAQRYFPSGHTSQSGSCGPCTSTPLRQRAPTTSWGRASRSPCTTLRSGSRTRAGKSPYEP